MADLYYWSNAGELSPNVQPTPAYSNSGTWADWLAWKAVHLPDPPQPPDWVGFRRELLSSSAYATVGTATLSNPVVAFLWTPLNGALLVDAPDPGVIVALWNQVERPLSLGEITWLRTAISNFNIPLSLSDEGLLSLL